MKEDYFMSLNSNLNIFKDESTHLRTSVINLQKETCAQMSLVDKLVKIVQRNDTLLNELKIHLKEGNVRVLYRLLNIPLPQAFKKLLAEDSDVDMWEIIMKRQSNKFDVKFA